MDFVSLIHLISMFRSLFALCREGLMSAASSSSSSDISCPPALQAAVAAAIGATAQRNTSVPESTSLFDCKRGVPRISIESCVYQQPAMLTYVVISTVLLGIRHVTRRCLSCFVFT